MNSPLDIQNGWRLYQYISFKESFDRIVMEVELLKRNNPSEYSHHPKAKILKRIHDLILHEIPADPNHPKYLLGNSLGAESRHWRRAKFLQRYRLFFRFDSRAKVIIYAWINDENSLRHEGSKSDPYEIFKKLLASGNPPNDWKELYNRVIESQ